MFDVKSILIGLLFIIVYSSNINSDQKAMYGKKKGARNSDLQSQNFITELKKLIHFPIRYYPIYDNLVENQEIIFKPIDLVSSWRFDILAKYIYAKQRELGVKCDWAKNLYAQHLKVWGNFHESWPAKNGLDEFLNTFHSILDSIKQNGFSARFSVIPIDKRKLISNGSHRVAACLLYNRDAICKYYAHWQAPLASAEFFRKNQQNVRGGLAQKYLDAMALEYSMLKKNTYIVHAFPVLPGNDEQVRAFLNEYGNIVYEKKVFLHHNGPFNFIKLIYNGCPWLGTKENNFQGARNDAKKRFANAKQPLRVYLFECENLSKVIECKNKIRGLFNLGNYSIHINDTHDQTVELAQTLFNDNSIHMLNWSTFTSFNAFDAYLTDYKEMLKKMPVNQECFCVDSSAVLSAYGIRDCKDLDFLHHGYEKEVQLSQTKFVSSHNSWLHHHTFALDDIIFNPENHFYLKGLKFAALHVIKNNEIIKKNFVLNIFLSIIKR